MEIELKANNSPTSPGFYLFKKQYDDIPFIVKIQVIENMRSKFEVISEAEIEPLTNFGSTVLWSDRIEVFW